MLRFELHPQNPQIRAVRQAAEIVRAGGVIAYPTDSCYALGCHIGDKDALERLRNIRQADRHHHFTLVCRDLAEIAKYAKIDTWQFRLLKACTPGPYTFLLEATRETPKRLQHEKRRTIGIRVPNHLVPRMLLDELGEPIMSSTLILPGEVNRSTTPTIFKLTYTIRLMPCLMVGLADFTLRLWWIYPLIHR